MYCVFLFPPVFAYWELMLFKLPPFRHVIVFVYVQLYIHLEIMPISPCINLLFCVGLSMCQYATLQLCHCHCTMYMAIMYNVH